MMKKVVIICVVLSFCSIGTISVIAASESQINNGTGNGMLQRLRNRICDTLGICQGGCDLITVTGLLWIEGTKYYIDETEIHFGPEWYITTAESSIDYDNDGKIESIKEEINGLVGTTITIEGHEQSDQWISVFTINGETYREPGQPIWAAQHQWQRRKRNGPNKP